MAEKKEGSADHQVREKAGTFAGSVRRKAAAAGRFLWKYLRICGIFLWKQLKRFGRFLYRFNLPLLRSPRRLSELFILPAAFIYFEIVFRLFGKTSLIGGFGYAVLFALGYGFAVDFIASFLVRKPHKVVMQIALFLAGAVYAFESIILASFQVYMTLATIFTTGGDAAGGFTGTVVSAVVGGIPRIILFMLPFALYTWRMRHRSIKHALRRSYSVELLVLAFLFCMAGTAFSNALDSEKYASQYDFDTATKTFGLLTGVRLDLKYSVFGNPAADSFAALAEAEESASESADADVQSPNIMEIDFDALAASTDDSDLQSLYDYIETLSASDSNDYTGLFEGKNLILICAEAFSGNIISKELTPTLYRLQHNGIYFSDYYQPSWGGSTSTGEFSFLMGLVPTNGTQTIQDTIENNNYFTMGNQMQRLGYFTLAFHNGSYSYYDRDKTHYNLGYDTWLGSGNGLEDYAGNSYPADDVAIEAMMEIFMDQEPFSIYWMTVSGHAAYKEDKVYVEENLDRVTAVLGEEEYSDTVLYYFCYQLALEDALTVLVDGLEEAGIADDTVICLTTDHYPYGLCKSSTYGNTKDYLEEFYDDTYDFDLLWERDRNALLLWCGSLEDEDSEYAVEISEPTYSLDILPTLSNLFGLEYDSRLLVGRDVFSDTDALVIWNNYTWMTVQGTYNAATGEYIPNDGYEYDEDYVSSIKDIVSNKITFSKLAVSTDLYGAIFGEDDVGETSNVIDLDALTVSSDDGGDESGDETDSTETDESEEDTDD